MSRWANQYSNNPFASTWASVQDIAADTELDSKVDDASAMELARLRKVLAYLGSIEQNIDPELMPSQLLKGMNQHATNCLNELNAFKGNGNVGHLQNANNALDQLLVIFQQTPFATLAQRDGAFGDGIRSFIDSLDKYYVQFKGRIDTTLEQLTTQAEAVRAESATLGQSLGEVRSEIATVKQTIEGQTAQFNTQFKASEESRTQRFEKQVQDLESKSDDEFKVLAGKAAAILEVLARLKSDAEEVYGVTIGTLQAGVYASYASEERRTANWFRWGALILMLVGVGILVVPEFQKFLVTGAEYKFDWLRIVGRATLILVVFVPAFYLARESGHHRNNEIVNRRRQHILSTIDPYLALIDKERAEVVKAEVARAIFSEGAVPKSDSDDLAGNLITQITNLIKQAKR